MKNPLTTKEIQNISLDILKTISSICEEQNLRYYLMYGTLIGAIRHEGFIPWDDDVDIMMPRPDYDKLLEYLEKNKDIYLDLEVFNRKTHNNYPYMITRISNNNYILDVENEKPYGIGVFIDIYPFDGLGKTEEESYKYAIIGDRLSTCCYQATRKHYSVETTKSFVRKIFKFPVFIISKIIGKDYFQKKLETLRLKYNYDESDYVGCFVWLSGGKKDIFKREWFNDYEMCSFENIPFRIPKEYDLVLKHIYGDYMTLPPKEERVGHHFYDAYHK